ncbi:MAG: DMT family transporter [Oceanicaulis sp.]
MNPSLLLPFAATVIAGAAVSLQPAFNGQLASHLGSPLRAALVSFTAGGLVLLAIVGTLTLRTGLPSAERIASTPLHLFVIGGTLGALFVTTAAWATPKIGAGAFFATLIAAQLIVSLILDHFGLIGLEARPANLVRVAGVALLIAGAWLVVKG